MRIRLQSVFLAIIFVAGMAQSARAETGNPGQLVAQELTDVQVEDIVRRSYQYVALYNVINKGAMDPENPASTGWNHCIADTGLKDHTLKLIARPNNDTLYITCMLELRKDAVILDLPAFESKYVSLMAVAYDHYVNVPMSTREGDFRKPEKVLFYSARTEGYQGSPVEGVDRIFEMTGDFVIAVFRVMPHSNEPAKFKRNIEDMQAVKLLTLSQFIDGKAKSAADAEFPPFGRTDADVFGNNLLQVMQFVFNHVSFDPNDEIDQGVLAAYKPLGVEPGKAYDASEVAPIDGQRFRKMAEKIQQETFAIATGGRFSDYAPRILRLKGETDLDALVLVSVVGPIGLPLEEATYPAVTAADGKPMNALHDYVIRMNKDELPPAQAFWSLTLYDLQNGFFIPNERKKYSVGENAGMKLDDEGGIEIYVAAEKPEGVPEENWLPINRKDEKIDLILRIYEPDLAKLKTWIAPKAEKLAGE